MGIAEMAMKTFICSYQIINYIDLISCSKTGGGQKQFFGGGPFLFFFKTYFGKYFFDSELHFSPEKESNFFNRIKRNFFPGT